MSWSRAQLAYSGWKAEVCVQSNMLYSSFYSMALLRFIAICIQSNIVVYFNSNDSIQNLKSTNFFKTKIQNCKIFESLSILIHTIARNPHFIGNCKP